MAATVMTVEFGTIHYHSLGGGGTPIETLYGDVPPKWVGFWQKIPKHGSHFWPQNP